MRREESVEIVDLPVQSSWGAEEVTDHWGGWGGTGG